MKSLLKKSSSTGMKTAALASTNQLEKLFSAIDRFKDEITGCGVIEVVTSSPMELRIHHFDNRSIRYRFSPASQALIRQVLGHEPTVLLDGVRSFRVEFPESSGPLCYILVLETGEQVRGFVYVKRRKMTEQTKVCVGNA